MRELRSIADKIFRNRNLQQVKSWEMLKDEWPEIKTAVWPMLRATIHTARMAREALRDGDIDKLNTLTDRTRLYHAYSEMELLWFGARVADRRHEAPHKIFHSRRRCDGGKVRGAG